MRTVFNNRGLSLIELVIAIVVIGIAIPALTRNWFDITKRSIESEELFDSTSYGEQLMEEIKSKRFDERVELPWTPVNFFGAKRADESNENNRTRYDDVDDYDGFNETLPGNFRSSVRVAYVNLTGTAWQNVTGDETDFKRVIVTVSRMNVRANTTLAAVIGRY
jgi:prepilin-type N-terminal cleavage/methylation domain-containing protein